MTTTFTSSIASHGNKTACIYLIIKISTVLTPRLFFIDCSMVASKSLYEVSATTFYTRQHSQSSVSHWFQSEVTFPQREIRSSTSLNILTLQCAHDPAHHYKVGGICIISRRRCHYTFLSNFTLF